MLPQPRSEPPYRGQQLVNGRTATWIMKVWLTGWTRHGIMDSQGRDGSSQDPTLSGTNSRGHPLTIDSPLGLRDQASRRLPYFRPDTRAGLDIADTLGELLSASLSVPCPHPGHEPLPPNRDLLLVAASPRGLAGDRNVGLPVDGVRQVDSRRSHKTGSGPMFPTEEGPGRADHRPPKIVRAGE